MQGFYHQQYDAAGIGGVQGAGTGSKRASHLGSAANSGSLNERAGPLLREDRHRYGDVEVDVGVFGGPFLAVLIIRALLFWGPYWGPYYWKLPCRHK